MPHSGREKSLPLSTSEEMRFDISQMAGDSDRANRKVGWLGLGVAIGAAVLFGFFAVVFVLAGYTYPTSFRRLLSIVRHSDCGGTLCLPIRPRAQKSYHSLHRAGRRELQLSRVHISGSQLGRDREPSLVARPEKECPSRRFVIGSDLGCRIKGGRRVVGGLGFSPISLEAFDAILAQAREQGVTVDPHSLSLGRGGVVKDVTVHRMFRPRG